jgi:SAM-dependent methyltransferase
MTWYQEWFGEEYLELYAHRDDAEARRHIEFFRTHCGVIHGPVLDLACGSGRHLLELEQAGYGVVGVDLSWALLRTARKERGELDLVRSDMRTLPFRERQFGAMVSFFTSFGYFEAEEDNMLVVSELARVAENSAFFLFDYLNVERERRGLVARETRRLDGREIEIERWFDEATHSFNKRICIDGRSYLERVRGYDLDEITMMFSSAGFSIHRAHGDFDGSAYDGESPRLILVGTRQR